MSDTNKILERLREPFQENDLEWRIQRAGEHDGRVWALAVPYVTARAVQDRLDDVVGPANWKTSFHQVAIASGGFICTLEICCGGTWVAKSDAADLTDIEPLKGGVSNALKRAAVSWGIGRYLYEVDTCWAETSKQKRDGWERGAFGPQGQRVNFWWRPPRLPHAPARQEEPAARSTEAPAASPVVENDPHREELKRQLHLTMQRHGVGVEEVERYCQAAFPGRGAQELLSPAELQVTINWIRHGAPRSGSPSNAA